MPLERMTRDEASCFICVFVGRSDLAEYKLLQRGGEKDRLTCLRPRRALSCSVACPDASSPWIAGAVWCRVCKKAFPGNESSDGGSDGMEEVG